MLCCAYGTKENNNKYEVERFIYLKLELAKLKLTLGNNKRHTGKGCVILTHCFVWPLQTFTADVQVKSSHPTSAGMRELTCQISVMDTNLVLYEDPHRKDPPSLITKVVAPFYSGWYGILNVFSFACSYVSAAGLYAYFVELLPILCDLKLTVGCFIEHSFVLILWTLTRCFRIHCWVASVILMCPKIYCIFWTKILACPYLI
jgi:hypothetical protein